MHRSSFTELNPAQFDELAEEHGIALPLEQSSHWDRFDSLMNDREPWLRLVWWVDDEIAALISLSRMKGRGFMYAWAKEGPVWAVEPSDAMQRAFRDGLLSVVRSKDPSIVFVRLHADDAGGDLSELLQSVTFDRTIILDLTQDEDSLMASMKKRGRRDVRKALRDESLVAADETDRAMEVFPELYEILTETGARDGFGIQPQSVYETMISSLGPHNCRLFTVRRDGRALCWGLVTVNESLATYYYAGSNDAGRKAGAPDMLVWEMTNMLRDLGVETFDLMGIDSERAPQLAGVRGFKTKFSDEVAEVPGAWDVPIHPHIYAGLTKALKFKRAAVARINEIRTTGK